MEVPILIRSDPSLFHPPSPLVSAATAAAYLSFPWILAPASALEMDPISPSLKEAHISYKYIFINTSKGFCPVSHLF